MMHRSMMRRTRGSGPPVINPGSGSIPKNDFDFYKSISDANEMLNKRKQQQQKKESKRSTGGLENDLKNHDNNKTPHKCMVINCESSKCTKKGKLKYFNFPDDPEMCMKWISIIKREDLLKEGFVYLSYECFLCSLHFTDNMFIDKSHNKLLENALPLDSIGIINETNINQNDGTCDNYDDEDDVPLKKISNH